MNKELTYNGDNIYTKNCTGDCVTGDEVAFERAIFTGTYKKPIFEGYALIRATIIKESYGKKTGQHTFTLETDSGEIFRIMGRNLYANGIYRKTWINEDERNLIAHEKHIRGGRARRERETNLYLRAY